VRKDAQGNTVGTLRPVDGTAASSALCFSEFSEYLDGQRCVAERIRRRHRPAGCTVSRLGRVFEGRRVFEDRRVIFESADTP